jgi:threonine aldolase
VIDLSSDFMAEPTGEMWAAMRTARPADLTRLEGSAADALGKEAAVWMPTCSMANLVALLTLCEPGDRVALVEDAHILTTEGMGIENVAHLTPVTLGEEASLVCVENTHTRAGGAALSVEETGRLCALAERAHLDGARLPNAAAALGTDMAALAAPADTVALSLNKGLCAPFGAVLAGDAAVLDEARVSLRRVGGASVHKAYVAAAAGIVALERMLDRVGDDHRRARDLAERLAAIDGLEVERPQTNIVFFAVEGWTSEALLDGLAREGVRGFPRDERRVRLVTHNDVGDADVERVAAAVAAVTSA